MVTPSITLKRVTLCGLLLILASCSNPTQDAAGWIASGALAATTDVPANGAIQARALQDGTFLLTVQLNIPQADAGSSYVVELQNEKGNIQHAGVLQSPLDDVRHGGEFVLPHDLRTFLDVSVARQSRSGGSTVVAKGTLKPVTPRL